MKKWNVFLNTLMVALVGAFLGNSAYVVWNFYAHPEQYAAQSAPWYTSILFYGIFTLVGLLICLVIKAVLKRKRGA